MQQPALLLALLAAAPISASMIAASDGAGDSVFSLQLLSDAPEALCLDGSYGGYYLRPGTGAQADTWVIELEGGGWCVSLSDCASRAKTDIGSSKGWPATGIPGMDGGANGWLSANCAVNPAFCNATMVHINYCDGGSFAGYRAAPSSGGSPAMDLYFRGASIFDAAVASLLARGMSSAREIVLKGCSAGGLATWLHADYFHEQMQSRAPGARVVAVPDAGFFLNHTSTAGGQSYGPLYRWVAETMNTSQVDAGCLAAHGADALAACFLAENTLPHVSSPIFATQDLVDSWQMANIYQEPCIANLSACTPAQVADMNRYRSDMLALLAPLTGSASNGAYLSSCVQHCHQNIDSVWTQELVETQTVQQTFLRWWTGGGPGAPLVVDGLYGTNGHCYGVPYGGGCTRW